MKDIHFLLQAIDKPINMRNHSEKNALRNTLENIKYIRDTYAQAVHFDPTLDEDTFYNFFSEKLKHTFYKKGSLLFHKGDPGKTMLIIISGQIAVALPQGSEYFSKLENEIEKLKLGLLNKAKEKMINPEVIYNTKKTKVKNLLPLDVFQKIDNEGSVLALSHLNKMGYLEADLLMLQIGKIEEYFYQGIFKYKIVALKNMGDILGDQALINNQPRNATAYAIEDAHVFSISKESYEQIFHIKIQDEKKRLKFFQNRFPDISLQGISKLMNYFIEKKFTMNQWIFQENEPVNNVYWIVYGEVEIYVKKKFESEEKNPLQKKFLPFKLLPLVKLQQKEFFGEEDFFKGNTTRTLSALCTCAETKVYVIHLDNFKKTENSAESSFFFALLQIYESKSWWFQTQANTSFKIFTQFSFSKNERTMNDTPCPPQYFRKDHPFFEAKDDESKHEYFSIESKKKVPQKSMRSKKKLTSVNLSTLNNKTEISISKQQQKNENKKDIFKSFRDTSQNSKFSIIQPKPSMPPPKQHLIIFEAEKKKMSSLSNNQINSNCLFQDINNKIISLTSASDLSKGKDSLTNNLTRNTVMNHKTETSQNIYESYDFFQQKKMAEKFSAPNWSGNHASHGRNIIIKNRRKLSSVKTSLNSTKIKSTENKKVSNNLSANLNESNYLLKPMSSTIYQTWATNKLILKKDEQHNKINSNYIFYQ